METMTQVMLAFKTSFLDGIERIEPMALAVYYNLVMIDFAWALARQLFNQGASIPKLIIEKTVRYGLFYYFIIDYRTYFDAIINSLIKVGLVAGGNKFSPENFINPSLIFELGMTKLQPIEAFIWKNMYIGSTALVQTIIGFFIYVLIWVAFAVIAIQIFITFLEVYVVGTLTVYFLAFGVNKYTNFLAEKSIGAILSFAIKLMTLAFVLSVAHPALEAIPLIETNTDKFLQSCMSLLLTAGMIAWLCWQAPSLAAGLMAGSPTLSAGGLAGGMMAGGTAGMIAGGGMGAIGTLAGNLGGSMANSVGNFMKGAGAAGGGGSAAAGLDNTAYLASLGAASDSGGGGFSSAGSGAGDAGLTVKGSDLDPAEVAAGVSSGSGSASQSAGTASVSGDGGTGYADQMTASIANNGLDSNGVNSGSSALGKGGSEAANAIGGDGSSAKMGTAEMGVAASAVSDFALANQAIPPEASPSGGIGININPDKDE